jgi:hypothetical protein
MPSFTDIASALRLPVCCMRNNPTPKQKLNDDLRVLGISFALYLTSYWFGFHSLCLISMATMNLLTFQVGITFHETYSKTIHINQFEELDSSMDEEDDKSEYLSLKQRQQGASNSRSLTEEQEEKLNQQLQQVVEETRLRNRKRSVLNTARTPSSTTLVEEGEVPPIAPSDTDEDYSDMPPLVSPDDETNPVISRAYTRTSVWSEVPNFSQTHYLHNYMDEVD